MKKKIQGGISIKQQKCFELESIYFCSILETEKQLSGLKHEKEQVGSKIARVLFIKGGERLRVEVA